MEKQTYTGIYRAKLPSSLHAYMCAGRGWVGQLASWLVQAFYVYSPLEEAPPKIIEQTLTSRCDLTKQQKQNPLSKTSHRISNVEQKYDPLCTLSKQSLRCAQQQQIRYAQQQQARCAQQHRLSCVEQKEKLCLVPRFLLCVVLNHMMSVVCCASQHDVRGAQEQHIRCVKQHNLWCA